MMRGRGRNSGFSRAIATLAGVVAFAILAVSCEKSPTSGAGGGGSTGVASTSGEAGTHEQTTDARAKEPRVVVLSPALAITLRDLGLAKYVVGRHGYDVALDAGIPVCGDQAGIDYEALIRARPTHVILQWGARQLPERLESLARDNGWIVVNQEVLTLADVRSSAVELLDLVAGPDVQKTEDTHASIFHPKLAESPSAEASEGKSLIDRMTTAFAKRGRGFAKAGRVLMLLSASPVSAVGPGSFHQQVLEAIGGTPALTRGGPYQEMDVEDVANLAPDAIVLLRPRGREAPPHGWTPDEIRGLLGPLVGKGIPAVERGHVAVIDDPLCLMPASSLADVADELAKILEAWNGDASPGTGSGEALPAR